MGGQPRDRYLDCLLQIVPDPPEGRCALMAQHRAGTAGQYRRHPRSVSAQITSTDGVHAAVDRVQPPSRDPVGDRLSGETERQQLHPGDHIVLRPGQLPGRRTRRLMSCRPHSGNKSSLDRTSPPSAHLAAASPRASLAASAPSTGRMGARRAPVGRPPVHGGAGNRTQTLGLKGPCSTFELHPRLNPPTRS